jgi:hypothetical protein
MAITILRGAASVRLRIPLDATGLTSTSAGLIISTICDNEATATVYTQAAGNIETISAIGTYAAPSSGKIRFAEVDATNHPGLYEIQIADARLNVTNSRTLVITCSGAGLPATGIHYEVDLEGTRKAAGGSVDTVTSVIDTVSANVQDKFDFSLASNGLNGVTLPANIITASSIASNAITDAKIATSACNKIMGGLVIGSQPKGSLAQFVRDIKNGDLLFEGQIVSATTDKAILDAGATTVCVGQAISIGEEGDAERQTRFVTAFDPATKEITLDRPWCVVPSNGADYQVKTLRNPLVGDRTKVLTGGFNEAIADTFSVLDTLTEDSSGLRYTAKALEQAPAGGSGTIIVQPIVGSTPERTAGATIRTFNGENYPATVSGVDAQGNVIDWTTLSNLEFVIDDQEGTDLAVIADANITKQTTFFSVVIPAAANIVPTGRNSIAYRWSIRNATSKVVALQGQVIVSRTALID